MLEDDLPDPQYAPLLDAEVRCAALDVYELDGGKWKPVYDHHEHLVQMLPTEGVRDLSSRVRHVGLYRVVARDPATQKMICRKDWNLRPTPVPGRAEQAAKPAVSTEVVDLQGPGGRGPAAAQGGPRPAPR